MTVRRAGTRVAFVAALLLVSSVLVSFDAAARVRSCLGAQVFASPIANGADYIEVYIESFRGNNAGQLSAQIATFAQLLG